MVVTAIIEIGIVEMEMVEMEMVKMEIAEMKIQMRMIGRDNCGQQPPFKRPNVRGQNVARAYTAGNNERKPYNGLLPLCNKCKLHHEGHALEICGSVNKLGHFYPGNVSSTGSFENGFLSSAWIELAKPSCGGAFVMKDVRITME
ncbi:hypothetical protein Tco_1354877 [Tanacetum coccineum]